MYVKCRHRHWPYWLAIYCGAKVRGKVAFHQRTLKRIIGSIRTMTNEEGALFARFVDRGRRP